jgi:hypothetical protein
VLAIVAAITAGALMPRWWLGIATVKNYFSLTAKRLKVILRFMMSLLGTFGTCRPALTMSAHRGRPEVICGR